MDATQRAELRKPFPKEQIGRVPAGKGRPALDFVGHAAVTDRLNTVVPDEWSYTVDEMFTAGGECWIRGTMTICGVSRVEYGDGKTPKEAISNFIRRAAMRYGVAIDLWSREELGAESAPPSPSRRSREAGGDGSPPTGHPPASDLPQREGAGETTGKAAADVEASGSGEAPGASTTCPDCGESDFTIVGLTDGQLRAGFVACVNTTCGRKYRRAA